MSRPTADRAAEETDFRPQATFWTTLSSLILVVPFAAYHAIGGRDMLSTLTTLIVLFLIVNAWHCRHATRASLLPAVTLMPLLIAFVAFATLRLHTVGVLWCFPAILAIYCMVPERWAIAGNLMLLLFELPIVWHVLDPALAVRASASLMAVSLFTAILVRVISRQQRVLHRVLITDYLTGCLNRITLDKTLGKVMSQTRAAGTQATLLAVDIDRFKRINDERGHAAGDEVLRQVAKVLLLQRRPGEHVFRTGGEEFLCVLAPTREQPIAERMDELYRALAGARPLPDQEVTVSVGVAVLEPGETAERWACRADAALYEAKSGGRDRFALAA